MKDSKAASASTILKIRPSKMAIDRLANALAEQNPSGKEVYGLLVRCRDVFGIVVVVVVVDVVVVVVVLVVVVVDVVVVDLIELNIICYRNQIRRNVTVHV